MADTALHLTEATFDEEVGKHQNVLMVDFWAEWCAPCRAIAPTLEELARESARQGQPREGQRRRAAGPRRPLRHPLDSDHPVHQGRQGGGDQVVGAVPKAQLKKKLDAIA